MARPRGSVCSFKPHAPLSPSLSLSNPHFFSNPLNSKTHILTHHHSHIVLVRDSRLLCIAKCRAGENKLPPTPPLLRGSELLGTRTERGEITSPTTGSIIRYITTGERV
ncbi:hypothetical protein PIB30_016308 [Stylosanthes scabra]|uniref:Uncharacterized protein n=1 Tax=Stylosanthes scabra TaxID=79078 RepID=A0ABU6R7K4_9FABA|nr:hypothetical protein [Stylosanthes scabra]